MNLTQTTETFGQDDQSWLASAHGTQSARSITLDTSTFTKATHYPAGYFPSGLPLGRITASGKFGPYDDTALDGRENLAGHLFTAVAAPADDTVDIQGALFWHGGVAESKLPVAIDAAAKADVAGSINYF